MTRIFIVAFFKCAEIQKQILYFFKNHNYRSKKNDYCIMFYLFSKLCLIAFCEEVRMKIGLKSFDVELALLNVVPEGIYLYIWLRSACSGERPLPLSWAQGCIR